MQVNGHYSPSLLLFVPRATRESRALAACLSDAGYTLVTVSSANRLRSMVREGTYDAVMAFGRTGRLVYENVRKEKIQSRPLLVMIDDDAHPVNSESPESAPDVVLCSHPEHISSQLRTLLQLRIENQQLRQQVDALDTQLEVQRRSQDTIELLKNAIVRNVSHELKTPLLQVKSAVSMVAEDARDSTLMKYAIDATARLETLVKNITMLGSSLDTRLGPVIVRDAVEYARRNLGRAWLYRGESDRIHIELAGNLPPVMADKQGLSTVLQLLMDNALKFSEGEIEISAEQHGEWVTISVRDQGIGIAQAWHW